MVSAAASPVMFSVSAETVETTAACAAPGSAAAAITTAIGRRIRRIAASCWSRVGAYMGEICIAPGYALTIAGSSRPPRRSISFARTSRAIQSP